MTKDEAMRRARELWGPMADVARRRDDNRHRRFVVGSHEHELKGGGPTVFRARGAGDSWEAAFQDAERQKRDVSHDPKMPTWREFVALADVTRPKFNP